VSASRIARRAAFVFAAATLSILGCRDLNNDVTGLRQPNGLAHDVVINPDGSVEVAVAMAPPGVAPYEGQWAVDGVVDRVTGDRTVTLKPGPYAFVFGNGEKFTFDVADDGSVTSGNRTWARGGAGTLTLNPLTVTIDPGAYEGIWSLVNSSGRHQGKQAVGLFLGLKYTMAVGNPGGFGVAVEDDGNVMADDDAKATGGPRSLTFNTVAVEVEPRAFTGTWSFNLASKTYTTAATVQLVPGLDYNVVVGGPGFFRVFVDVMGNVFVAPEYAASADGDLGRLLFKTVTLKVDPGSYLGGYQPFEGAKWTQGASAVEIVPGLPYWFHVGVPGFFTIDVDDNGGVRSQSDVSATGDGSTLTLRSAPVTIAPSDESVTWLLNTATGFIRGTSTVSLVPGVKYWFNDTQDEFTLDAPCRPTPSEVASKGVTYSMSCAKPNQPPMANAGGPYTGVAGKEISFDGSGSTDADGDGLTYSWNFGDDSPEASGVRTTHAYAVAGDYVVTLTVADPSGASSSNREKVTVTRANQAPKADGGGDRDGIEGVAIQFDGSASSDPDGDALTYSWDFGDKSGPENGISPSHVYTEAGTYAVTLTVTDPSGAFGTATVRATVKRLNHAPVAVAGGPYEGVAGVAISFNGGGSSDPDGDTFEYAWDFGDGSLPGKGDRTTHAYAPGTYTVRLTVTDPSGAFGTATATVTVTRTNHAPAANAGGPYAGAEGSAIALDGALSKDSDGDALSYSWNFGDGSLAGSGATTTHAYADNGSYTVTLTVTDPAGASNSSTATVVVNNAAPSVGTITAPVDPVPAGTTVTVNASFTDAGTGDTHTATIDWDANGEPTVQNASVTETKGSGTASSTHKYEEPGVYTIKLTVKDDDQATDAELYQYVVVYDPTAGYVIGGGWIDSPQAACRLTTACTNAKGQAIFGFVSKYMRGMSVPSGITEFGFRAGNFYFSAWSYDWMVVSGTMAKYSGHGKVNGAGDYGFILTAIDGATWGRWTGEKDRFRIKIWDRTTGKVVYDNQMGKPDDSEDGTVLAGGSIVIRR
jgi:PKD repeat protein